MSTELQSTENFMYTRYWGGKENGQCLQLTQNRSLTDQKQLLDGGYVQMTRGQAYEVAVALMAFANGEEKEA